MMLRRTLLLCTLLLAHSMLHAQEPYVFTKGLISGPCHQYGRQALFTDRLAWLLNASQLPTPVEGGSAPTADKETSGSWQAITADDNGMFKGRAINNGYLY